MIVSGHAMNGRRRRVEFQFSSPAGLNGRHSFTAWRQAFGQGSSLLFTFPRHVSQEPTVVGLLLRAPAGDSWQPDSPCPPRISN